MITIWCVCSFIYVLPAVYGHDTVDSIPPSVEIDDDGDLQITTGTGTNGVSNCN
jgi:hypothetical protein